MRVRVVTYERDGHTGNILWPGAYRMRNGKFPSDHPCANCPEPLVAGPYKVRGPGGAWEELIPEPTEVGDSGLDRFRALGYWASCFPEGDGITFIPLREQSPEKQVRDVREAFGWEVYRQ